MAKKDGMKRLCVDYLALNSVIVMDAYPLPRIDDTLDTLAGVQWFSTLALKSGITNWKWQRWARRRLTFLLARASGTLR